VTTVLGAPESRPARRRILDTASTLFYAQGVHAVGIDRIIAEAAVAKATFYNHFATKDELVRAYIQEQSQLQRDAVAQFAQLPARQALLTIFDVLVQIALGPAFRGCPFINVAAEYPDPAHPVRQAIADHRRWFRTVLRDLLVADGRPDADTTADILVVLRDGLVVGSDLDDPHRLRAVISDALTRVIGTSSTR